MEHEVELLTEDEARARVREYVDSREWWIIPWVSWGSAEASREIEERFYPNGLGGSTDDFQAIFTVIPVTFGKKSALSAEALSTYMAEKDGNRSATEWERQLTTQDVVIFVDEGDPLTAFSLAAAWHDWVMGR